MQKEVKMGLSFWEKKPQEHISEVGDSNPGHCNFSVQDRGVLFYASEISVLENAGEDRALEEQCAA